MANAPIPLPGEWAIRTPWSAASRSGVRCTASAHMTRCADLAGVSCTLSPDVAARRHSMTLGGIDLKAARKALCWRKVVRKRKAKNETRPSLLPERRLDALEADPEGAPGSCVRRSLGPLLSGPLRSRRLRHYQRRAPRRRSPVQSSSFASQLPARWPRHRSQR